LVQGKRELFDNVVHEQATEDVVSVSKRLAEVLAEDLASGSAGDQDGSPVTPTTQEQTDSAPEPNLEPNLDLEPDQAMADAAKQADSSLPLRPDLDEAVRDCVIGLQQHFGARILRLVGQRRRANGNGSGAAGKTGMGGLLVVLDQVTDSDDVVAERLSERVPVALIDRRTLARLSRLGDASPVADGEAVYAADLATTDATGEPALLRKAREGLEAARLLIQQRCPGPALELLLSGLLAVAAHRAGRADPPSPAQAGIWLYGEALPAGLLEQQDAALLMRAMALAQGADAVPETLLRALADDTASFIDHAASINAAAESPRAAHHRV
jgi:hypothetical protein